MDDSAQDARHDEVGMKLVKFSGHTVPSFLKRAFCAVGCSVPVSAYELMSWFTVEQGGTRKVCAKCSLKEKGWHGGNSSTVLAMPQRMPQGTTNHISRGGGT